MQKRLPTTRQKAPCGPRCSLFLLGLTFSLGGLLGCLMASWIGGAGEEELAAYISAFLQAAQGEFAVPPTVFSLLWEQGRYPFAVLLFSFTALGVIAIPVLFGVRAFFLSFAISAFVRMFGAEGVVLSLILFGLSGMLSVPALFLLGTQGWQAACALAGRGSRRRGGEWGRPKRLACGCICAACVLLSVLVERFCTLPLLAWSAGSL